MAKYVVKRILLAIATIFIVCVITFFAMNAIPGGPFDGEKATTPEVKAALEKRYNLDKPVPEQFVIYMGIFSKVILVSLQKQDVISEKQFSHLLRFQRSWDLWQ